MDVMALRICSFQLKNFYVTEEFIGLHSGICDKLLVNMVMEPLDDTVTWQRQSKSIAKMQ